MTSRTEVLTGKLDSSLHRLKDSSVEGSHCHPKYLWYYYYYYLRILAYRKSPKDLWRLLREPPWCINKKKYTRGDDEISRGAGVRGSGGPRETNTKKKIEERLVGAALAAVFVVVGRRGADPCAVATVGKIQFLARQ